MILLRKQGLISTFMIMLFLFFPLRAEAQDLVDAGIIGGITGGLFMVLLVVFKAIASGIRKLRRPYSSFSVKKDISNKDGHSTSDLDIPE